jgi:hypothetical protein
MLREDIEERETYKLKRHRTRERETEDRDRGRERPLFLYQTTETRLASLVPMLRGKAVWK